MPQISVLLPVYNAAHSIGKAISSIINQHFTDWELIIINDGSTDDSMDVVRQFTDKRISIISSKCNEGIARALNKGINSSRADIIARMDADDESFPNRLALQYAYLAGNPSVDVVGCLVTHGGLRKLQQGYALYIEWINKLITHEAMHQARFTESPLAHPSVMLRKSVFEKYGCYDTAKLPEDYELWLRLLQNGCRFGKVDQTLVQWNDPPGRLSRIHKNYTNEAFLNVKAKYLRLELDQLPPKPIYIWGYGKQVFRKAELLQQADIRISGFIDIRPKGQRSRNILDYRSINDFKKIRIISLVSDRSGSVQIMNFLQKKKLLINKDYFMLS